MVEMMGLEKRRIGGAIGGAFSVLTIADHTDHILSLSMSKQESGKFCTTSADGTAIVYKHNLKANPNYLGNSDRLKSYVFHCHDGMVIGSDLRDDNVLTFSNDGYAIVSPITDTSVSPVKLNHNKPVLGGYLLEEGRVFTYTNDGVTLWDSDENILFAIETKNIKKAICSDDCSCFALYADNSVHVYTELRKNIPFATYVSKKYTFTAVPSNIAFSPNNDYVAVFGTNLDFTSVISVSDPEQILSFNNPIDGGGITGNFTHNGERLVIFDSNGCSRWSTRGGLSSELSRTLQSIDDQILNGYASDKFTVAYTNEGYVLLFDNITSEVYARYRHNGVCGIVCDESDIISYSKNLDICVISYLN